MAKYLHPRKTWSYSKDFKVKAVKLSYQAGLQVKQVAVRRYPCDIGGASLNTNFEARSKPFAR